MKQHPLESILRDELRGALDDSALHERLSEQFPEHRNLLRFLALHDRHARQVFYIKAERAWFRRFGWRVIRPLLILGILAGLGFGLQRTVDPTLGVMLFLAGAASLYVVVQLMAHRWANRDLKRLPRLEADYRAEVEALLETLKRGRN
jgi:hypothetical protein